MAIITISRQSGSLGDELSLYLSTKLGCEVITRQYVLENVFSGISEEEAERLSESSKHYLSLMPGKDITYKEYLSAQIKKLSDESSNLIVVGLGGFEMLRGREDTINIRVVASKETRVGRIARQFNVSKEEAEASITNGDRKHKRFVSILWDTDLSETEAYDLTINTDSLSVEEAAAAILALVSKKEDRMRISKETEYNDSINHQSQTPVFKNETEAEFARILDMYNIEWMYEPKTFPIEWDEEGNIKMAFSPDFYLPKFNLYLELTIMDQKYVTKKNKKARKVMELYPGTNVRIVYKKDFMELVERLKQFGG